MDDVNLYLASVHQIDGVLICQTVVLFGPSHLFCEETDVDHTCRHTVDGNFCNVVTEICICHVVVTGTHICHIFPKTSVSVETGCADDIHEAVIVVGCDF